MKTALIAGGAGFIGINLTLRLLKEGYNIICVDNFSSSPQSNIKHFISCKNYTILEHDITMPFHRKNIDMIFNLACPASPVNYQCNPIQTTKTAVIGTINMLDLAIENNCPILQASTSEIYGDPNIHPQHENYWGNVNPNGIRSCYDEGKRCAESLCMDYKRKYSLAVKIIRIFNTYGPYMAVNDGRVISNFILQALTHQDITVYGNGNQTRSFQYVDDLIEGMIRMIKTPISIVGPVNIGNPDEHSIVKLANKIIDLTNSNSKIIYRPLPNDDPRRRCPDISLAKRILHGWKPNISLDQGIRLTIDYFKKLLNESQTI